MSFTEISGLREVAPRYRALFVDAYGVLHDGAASFPGAPEALRQARAGGLLVAIVTNSAGRVDQVGQRLLDAGIGRDCYDAIVSSGELSWQYLAEGSIDPTTPLFVVTEQSGPAWVAKILNPAVADIDRAGAILAAGMPFATEEAFYGSNFAEELQRGALRKLPMIVADSDETYPSRGRIRLGPGWLARLYGAMGGPLVEFGKPHRPIYDAAIELLGQPAASEILAIGDNLLTDITGAAAFGIDSALVIEGGVHKDMAIGELRTMDNVSPTYVTRWLTW